jgi:ABC-2 type transport system ATP-binding protein
MTGQGPVAVPGRDLRPSGWPDRDAAPGPAAIVAAELVKTYPGGIQAVRGISFSVAAGESFGLLGPNGAGKTTTIGMLNTTVRPTSGRALLAGHDVQADPMGARRVSSVVFQDPVVDRPLTGRQNLRLHLRLWRVPKAEGLARLAELTKAVGLAPLLDRPVATYSGGERRRLEIVRALLSAPRVLFLDEPTVGLDTRIRHDLFDTIAALRERTGVTVLLTTHYLDEAERLCDRLAIIDGGRIVACDTPAMLLADLGEAILELRVAADPAVALAALRADGLPGDGAVVIGGTVTIPLRGFPPSRAMELASRLDMPVRELVTRVPTLDDVYLRLTGNRISPD